MNKTKIEWTDYTWNPVTGCEHGCEYCYARRISRRFNRSFEPTFHIDRLSEPLKTRKPSKIFVSSMGDLFGNWITDEIINDVLDVVKKCPQHTFQFLTKNPKRYAELGLWPSNCWLGATATDQKMFDDAAFELNQVMCKVSYISVEPFLEPIRFNPKRRTRIHWLIIGAQTNPLKMPGPGWVLSLTQDAGWNGTRVFHKDNLNHIIRIREFPAT